MAFWSRRPATRADLLAAADRDRARGRVKAAVATYRRVLLDHGDDALVRGKLAPLLAYLDEDDEAVDSFRRAAEGHLAAGFLDRALAVYTQARAAFPLEAEFHSEAARIHLLRGRRADGAIVLAEGGQALGRTRRTDAIEMLRGALGIQPGHLPATLTLARLLRQDGQRDEARRLLEGVEGAARGAWLRRVRWALFRTEPGLHTGWRWLRSLPARA